MKTKPFEKVSLDTLVGKVRKIGERELYPVIQIKTIREKTNRVFGAWVSPLAIVVVEPSNKYVISLTNNTYSLEQILKKAPSLKKLIADR